MGIRNMTLSKTVTLVAISEDLEASPAVEWVDGKPSDTPMTDADGRAISRIFGLAPLVGRQLATDCSVYLALEGAELPALKAGQQVKARGELKVWPELSEGRDGRKHMELGTKFVGILLGDDNGPFSLEMS